MSFNKNAAIAQLPELLQKAVTSHQAGDLNTAKPLYEQFLADNPKNPTALQLSGLLYSQCGDYDMAISRMRESLQYFPEQAEVANNLGNALSESGQLDEARESYLQAVKISPDYADAWRNLGLCYLALESLEQAKQAFLKCLVLQTDDVAACLGMSNVLMREHDFDAAIEYLQTALSFKSDYAEAHHNLGVCLRAKQKPEEAIKHFYGAQELGLNRAELYQNLASTQVDIQDIPSAIASYRMAIERNPEDVISHRNLNKLLWEQELLDDYLHSYRDALIKIPGSERLALSYGIALNQQEYYERAEQVLSEGLRQTPHSSELKSVLAYTYEGQNEWEQALKMHAEAIASPNSIANHLVSYARALLARQRPEEALKMAEEAANQTPFNQRAIAYLGLCWRMLDNEADVFINYYDNLVQVYDVPVPPRFSDAAEFNQQLTAVLNVLHLAKRHPPEQTLRGGTQTHGNLFERHEPEIQELVSGLSICVQDYIEKLPENNAHPLKMRRSEKFNYSGSWSVKLQNSGYHTMHVHPLGWLSSAYYVQVPTELSESDVHGGGIKFGEPDIDLGWRGMAVRKIQPHAGRLVLFPSYMWHGTIPFESTDPRMTVAFDVVPDHEQENTS